MADKDYQLKREIGIKILEQLGEWTDEYGLETSMDMETLPYNLIKSMLEISNQEMLEQV